jgi:phosphoheptose isomerase
MKIDPRHKNKIFLTESVNAYRHDYVNELTSALSSIEDSALTAATDLLLDYYTNNNYIFSIGNGGSHSIADHLCCDFVKGSFQSEQKRFRVIPLASLVSLNSAAANDFGHDYSFAKMIEFLGDNKSLLIAISSSGNSKNIIEAVKYNKKLGGMTIGMSGFDGGELSNISDISIHVNSNNYGIVEDAHQSLVHIFSQFIVNSK